MFAISPEGRYNRRDDEWYPADQAETRSRPGVGGHTARPCHGRARDRISRGGRKAVRDPSSRSLSRLSPRPSSPRGAVRRSLRMSWQMDSRPSRVPAQRDARRSRIPGVVCRSLSLHHLTIGKRAVRRAAGFVSFRAERPAGRADIEHVAPVMQKAGHVADRTDGVDGRWPDARSDPVPAQG